MQRLSSLSPAETLAMAICIEGANAARHTVWADRFRPFNKDLSKILDGIAEEDRLSQKKLKDLFQKRYHKKADDDDEKKIDTAVGKANEDLEHFFVLDEDMSKQIMMSVLKAEYETLVFFQEALFNTKDKNMKNIYKLLADYEKQHVNELRENLEQTKGLKRAKTSEDIQGADDDADEQKMFSQNYKNTKWRDLSRA